MFFELPIIYIDILPFWDELCFQLLGELDHVLGGGKRRRKWREEERRI